MPVEDERERRWGFNTGVDVAYETADNSENNKNGEKALIGTTLSTKILRAINEVTPA